jgi:hypothetical protein
LIGEALHLIQDGYAPADVEGDPPAKAGSDPRDSEIADRWLRDSASRSSSDPGECWRPG